MPRTIASFLAALVVFLGTTFAGMTLFDMHEMGDMGTHPMSCVDHCLSTVSSLTSAVPVAGALLLLVVFLALFCREGLFPEFRVARNVYRWREGIGKILLKRQLATVILRN